MDDLIEQLLPAVEQQLASAETPYVVATYDRLLTHDDIEADEAKQMIAFCLADELEAMDQEDRDFSATRYQLLLDLLPAMPEARS